MMYSIPLWRPIYGIGRKINSCISLNNSIHIESRARASVMLCPFLKGGKGCESLFIWRDRVWPRRWIPFDTLYHTKKSIWNKGAFLIADSNIYLAAMMEYTPSAYSILTNDFPLFAFIPYMQIATLSKNECLKSYTVISSTITSTFQGKASKYWHMMEK